MLALHIHVPGTMEEMEILLTYTNEGTSVDAYKIFHQLSEHFNHVLEALNSTNMLFKLMESDYTISITEHYSWRLTTW